MSECKPLVFVDLDDTLFQTKRKIETDQPLVVASFDTKGEPSGYMTKHQTHFIHWLLETTDVIPVTARSVEAFQRVDIPFKQGAICAHGGVILDAAGQVDPLWHSQMHAFLSSKKERLSSLLERAMQKGRELGFSLRGWVVEELDLSCYVVIKRNEGPDELLVDLMQALSLAGDLEDMYVHINGNNLAFLPLGLEKKRAVQEWLSRIPNRSERPVLGFGDSISDFGFMQECHWFGGPSKSQLSHFISSAMTK